MPLIQLLDETNSEAASVASLQYYKGNFKPEKKVTYVSHDGVYDLSDAMQLGIGVLASGNYLFTKKSYERAGGYQTKGLETWVFGFKQLATGTKIAILPNSFYWHRVSEDSLWAQLEKAGLNDKAVLDTVLQHPELFTKETNSLFKKLKQTKKEKQFFPLLKKGEFQLIPIHALQKLFEAYKHEERREYQLAKEAYLKAIELGCTNKKIQSHLQNITHT